MARGPTECDEAERLRVYLLTRDAVFRNEAGIVHLEEGDDPIAVALGIEEAGFELNLRVLTLWGFDRSWVMWSWDRPCGGFLQGAFVNGTAPD